MASLKVCFVLLISLAIVLISESEARRGRNRERGTRRNRNRDRQGDEIEAVDSNCLEDGTCPENGVSRIDPDVDNYVRRPNRRRDNQGGRGGRRRQGRRGSRRRGGRGGRGGRRRGQGRGVAQAGRRGFPSTEMLNMHVNAMAAAVGKFGLNLYQQMIGDNANFVISPYCIHTALSMLLLGAKGATKKELKKGLEIPDVRQGMNLAHSAHKAYNDSLIAFNAQNDFVLLSIANSLYFKRGLSIQQQFNNTFRRFYGSNMNTFAENNPEVPINDFVREATRGEIDDFLEAGTITPDTAMMIINAIYFKGMWETGFDPADTSSKTFTGLDGSSASVDMMRKQGQFKIKHSSELQASFLELPYKGNRFAMYIVLPDAQSSLPDVESRLTFNKLNATISGMNMSRSTVVEIPKFKLETQQEMKEALKAMGIRVPFDPQRAKFKRINRRARLFVEKVLHESVVEVNEEGTTASAATGVQISLTSMPQTFSANRPFMFLIRDKIKGIILFVGRVTDMS